MNAHPGNSMIKSKFIDTIAWLAMFGAAVLAFALMVLGNLETISSASAADTRYVESLFSDSVMQIDIQVDSEEWEEMLQNAQSKEYISVDLTIDGTSFSTVGIRTKGNSSLMSGQGTGRYSFKLEFDHYIDGQTCYGLDKFVLNNMQSDNTYMKEYLSYQIMSFIGVPSSLCRFASVSVNGEVLGLYLAVEGVEESYAARNDTGLLYKPESDSLAFGDQGNAEIGGRNPMEEGFQGQIPELPDSFREEGSSNTTQPDPSKEESGEAPPAFPAEGEAPDGESGSEVTPPGQSEAGGIQSDPPSASGQQDESAAQNRPFPNADQNGQDVQGEENPSQNTEENGNSFVPPDMQGRDFPGNGGGMMGGDDASALKYIDDDPDSYSTIFDNEVFEGTSSDYARVIAALKALNEGADNLEDYIDVEEVLRYFAANTILVNLDSYQGSMLHNYYLEEKDGVLSILPWDFNLSFGGFGVNSAEEAVNFPIDSPTTSDLSERPLLGKLLEVEEYQELYHQYLDEIITGYFESGLFEVTVTKLNAMISEYVKNDPTAFCTYEEYQNAVETLKTFGALRAESVRGQLDGSIPSTSEAQNENPELLVDASGIDLSVMGSQGGGGGAFGGRERENGRGRNTDTSDDSQNPDAIAQAMEIITQNETLTEDQKQELISLGFTQEEITSFMEQKNTFVQGMQSTRNDMQAPPDFDENEQSGWQRTSSDSNGSSPLWVTGISVGLLIIGIVFAFRLKRNF